MEKAYRSARIGIEPTTQVCLNCKHFYRHYQKCGWPFDMGHCAYPRLKNKRITDTCDNFELEEG